MKQYIEKSVITEEIKRLIKSPILYKSEDVETRINILEYLLSSLDSLEVKEVDLDKMLCFRRNIGFAYPEGASEYQKHLACYRQGIEDVLKAQKGE